MSILVSESIRGAGAAHSINAKLASLGIHDVKLLYDKNIQPYGMWVVTQIKGKSSVFLLPNSYNETDLEPYILWYCKDEQTGKFREPNDEDLMNIITVVKRAPEIWAQGERRADKFDEADAKKDDAHRQKLKDTVHDIAKPMKRAIQKGNF